ncbi:response regulator [Phenylobacterium sp.]|uniref:response regulator transcription factor n=1 Tax=Phenylobacterium sp. TaxID=1871053 RepID=UPI0012005239|nr:response regulator [Phenylobacterium sp.]THD57477.1 MAG: response regulator transcription factor [Phenylobacterium sp.]
MASIAYAHIVDDDPAVAQTLVYLLASAGIASMTYSSAEDLLGSVVNLSPGCVLTDVRMPGMGGMELLDRLKAVAPTHPVIVMTGHGDIALAVEAMKAGAVDFLVKPFAKSAVVAAVEASLLVGSESAARGDDVANYRKVFATLTPRQRDILGGILAGKLNKTIAHEFGISIRTVEVHRADIMQKTGASRSGGLLRMAMLAGM